VLDEDLISPYTEITKAAVPAEEPDESKPDKQDDKEL